MPVPLSFFFGTDEQQHEYSRAPQPLPQQLTRAHALSCLCLMHQRLKLCSFAASCVFHMLLYAISC